MAAPLLYHIQFEMSGKLPTIETILLEVMNVTGLTVTASTLR